MQTLAPIGLQPVAHPSGTIRTDQQTNGVASGYASNLFSGTPVKRTTDGTLIATATGADTTIGIFMGCEFASAGKRFILPYWPANQTYDADQNDPMIAYFTSDADIIYEGQANGTVNQSANGEGINLNDSSASGSTFTGQSQQALNHTTTGATAATFQVIGLAPYPNNAWSDVDATLGAFPMLRVKISTYQGQVA